MPGLVGVPGSLIAVHGFGSSLGSPIEVPDWDPNLVFLGVPYLGSLLGYLIGVPNPRDLLGSPLASLIVVDPLLGWIPNCGP